MHPFHSSNRIMASVAVVVFATSVAGCGGDDAGSTPSTPTTPSAIPSSVLQLELSNLRARQIGLHSELCPPSSEQYRVWDELRFDYTGASEQQLVGANVSYREVDGLKVAIGPVGRCQSDPAPCSNSGICLLNANGTSGSVLVLTSVRWQPSWTWSVLVDSAAPLATSNTLTATIQRSDGLPSGDRAAFVSLRVRRIGSSGQYDYAIYSPGVSGRVIMHRLRIFESGRVFDPRRDSYTSSTETPNSTRVGTSGGIVIPVGPFEAVADFVERDALGGTVSSGTMTTLVP